MHFWLYSVANLLLGCNISISCVFQAVCRSLQFTHSVQNVPRFSVSVTNRHKEKEAVCSVTLEMVTNYENETIVASE